MAALARELETVCVQKTTPAGRMQEYFTLATLKTERAIDLCALQGGRSSMFQGIVRGISCVVLALLFACPAAFACLRPTPDKRAIQWSDGIVRGKLKAVTARGADGEDYEFEVVEAVEGPAKPGQLVRVLHRVPTDGRELCAGPLSTDDVGKVYLVLLRSIGSKGQIIVTFAPVDSGDPSASAAFKQLLDETRKAEVGLTEDQVKAEALALSSAEDETEAEHAEATLLEMGPKAGPAIKRVMSTSSEAGKSRLQKVLDEIMPPAMDEATTKPVEGK
jgi:hypothetical protein